MMEVRLTERQSEIICLIANGLRIADIALELHISVATVDKTLKAARKKNNANTVAHLVSMSIAAGLLAWNEDDHNRQVADLTTSIEASNKE